MFNVSFSFCFFNVSQKRSEGCKIWLLNVFIGGEGSSGIVCHFKQKDFSLTFLNSPARFSSDVPFSAAGGEPRRGPSLALRRPPFTPVLSDFCSVILTDDASRGESSVIQSNLFCLNGDGGGLGRIREEPRVKTEEKKMSLTPWGGEKVESGCKRPETLNGLQVNLVFGDFICKRSKKKPRSPSGVVWWSRTHYSYTHFIVKRLGVFELKDHPPKFTAVKHPFLTRVQSQTLDRGSGLKQEATRQLPFRDDRHLRNFNNKKKKKKKFRQWL